MPRFVADTDLDPAHLSISAGNKLQVAAGAGGKRRSATDTVTPAPTLTYLAGHGDSSRLTATTRLVQETATTAFYRISFAWVSTTIANSVTQLRLNVPDPSRVHSLSCGMVNSATSQEPSTAAMVVGATHILCISNNTVATYQGYVDFGYALP